MQQQEFYKNIQKTRLSRQIAAEFLLSLKATKKKEAAAPQRAGEVKMEQLNAQPCPGCYTRISRTPHKIHLRRSGSSAVWLSNHECGQQGEALPERHVQKSFCLLLSLLCVLQPLPRVGKENCGKTVLQDSSRRARVQGTGAQADS